MKDLISQITGVWQSLPRVIQYGIVSVGLAAVQTKFPGHLPADLTPAMILGGGLLSAGLHHAEDRHEDSQKDKP